MHYIYLLGLAPAVLAAPPGVLPTRCGQHGDRVAPAEALVPPAASFFAASERHRLLVLSAPKAGATLAVQLMLRADGLTETALAYARARGSAIEHAYHVAVVLPRRNVSSCRVCESPAWSCVKMVRSPWDRAVSSYLRTANKPSRSNWPELRPNASFAEFLRRLSARANQSVTEQRRRAAQRKADHYLPQERAECDNIASLALIPTECAATALLHLSAARRERQPAYALLDGRNLSSDSHYHVQRGIPPADSPVPVADLGYSKVASGRQALPYDEFLRDAALRALVARLFAADFRLYQQACRQPWVQRSDECVAACAHQLCREWSRHGSRPLRTTLEV